MEEEKAVQLANQRTLEDMARVKRQEQEMNQFLAARAQQSQPQQTQPAAQPMGGFGESAGGLTGLGGTPDMNAQGQTAPEGGMPSAAPPIAQTFGQPKSAPQVQMPKAVDMMRAQIGAFDNEIAKIRQLATPTAYAAEQKLVKEREGVVEKLRVAEKDEFDQKYKEAQDNWDKWAGVTNQQGLDVVTSSAPPEFKEKLAQAGIFPNFSTGQYNINDPRVQTFVNNAKNFAQTQVQRYEQEKRVADIVNQERTREQRDRGLAEQERSNRARQGLEREKFVAQQNADKKIKTQIVTSNDGTAKLFNVETGELIKDLGVVAKPSAAYEKDRLAKKQLSRDLDSTIDELKEITKKGGLIDQSTGSGAGALIDAAAGFFGTATPGAIAVGKLAPIYDKVLKMVPRFEGPQSDKDTASYKEAAGNLANPAIPNDQKKAAAKEILRLMEARKGQFGMVGVDVTSAQGGVDTNNPLLK